MSFPRDLIVDIPGHGRGQLNAAIGIGGPSLLSRRSRATSTFPINHFLQVDFASFPEIVSAIGKVKVWFPTPVHDPYIGLDIEHAGCVALDGRSALAYAVSRHYYVPDDTRATRRPGCGTTTPSLGDASIGVDAVGPRSAATSIASRVSSTSCARSPRPRSPGPTTIPLRIIGLVDAVMTHLTTDQTLKLDELKSLVRTFQPAAPGRRRDDHDPVESDPATA